MSTQSETQEQNRAALRRGRRAVSSAEEQLANATRALADSDAHRRAIAARAGVVADAAERRALPRAAEEVMEGYMSRFHDAFERMFAKPKARGRGKRHGLLEV